MDPIAELPDETRIERVRFPERIRTALVAGGLSTVGQVREASDDDLLRLQHFGKASLVHLRKTLGLASSLGVNCPASELMIKTAKD